MRPGNMKSVARGRFTHRLCGPELGAAKQEFKDDADINRILARYRQAGVEVTAGAHQLNPRLFGQDTGFKTYADAHEALEAAKVEFLRLPPEIRLELGNDPARYSELSTEDGLRRVVERIGVKERRRLDAAQRMVAKHMSPPPTPPADPASKPPKGGTP